ncbi:CueP family metal-binding protein [Paeniglutamicibacter gangotriensis]|uniref:Lipoprotein n=1 Tax=Paeniglutamicibacter gangotriensis Lz1y TaxID=1276920 RepID=M7NDP5_9MICC|nr:CueP family metal-binding protein [Paeniglutamicibacter gangotriensis]EMQ96633.1 hypothetical protein ADIAG_04057 [Paeniglutamicibacter gangotriensis Lz1y]
MTSLSRRSIIAGGLGLLGSTALVACSPQTSSTLPAAPKSSGTVPTDGAAKALGPQARKLFAAHGIQADTAEDAITALDQMAKQRPLPLTGSVGYDQVLFSDDTNQVNVPLTGGQFYLSMAPYRTQTHECYYHSLGGCQGELTGTPVHVTVTTDSGQSLVDEDAVTYTNGFIGFWIPRDHTGTVTVTTPGETATSTFNSGPDGPTCLTGLHLS